MCTNEISQTHAIYIYAEVSVSLISMFQIHILVLPHLLTMVLITVPGWVKDFLSASSLYSFKRHFYDIS